MEDKHTKRDKDDYDYFDDNKNTVVGRIKNDINNMQTQKYPRTRKKSLLRYILIFITAVDFILMCYFRDKEPEYLRYIFIGIFEIMVLSVIIITAIKEKRAFKAPPRDSIRRTVEVVGCCVSSQITFFNKTKVNYRVMVSLDGENIETFSKREYFVGDKISVYVTEYPKKRVYIENN